MTRTSIRSLRDSEKAAVTARAVSRLLRKAGFQMADTSNRYKWTEGFHVSRVGISGNVSVGYHFERGFTPTATQREQIAKVRDFLKSKGYALDERGWIVG